MSEMLKLRVSWSLTLPSPSTAALMYRIVIGRLKFQHQRTLHFLSLSIIMVYVLKCNNDYVSTGWYRGFALKNPNIKVKMAI